MSSKDNKKDHLLDIASKLFYEQGYRSTGIKQIIDEAGIAKGTFYSHFKSKDDLGLAWLQKRHQQWNTWREEHVAQTNNSSKDQLLSLFTFLEQWMEECDYRGCAFLNTMAETPDTDNPMRKEIQNHKDSHRQFIRRRVDAVFPLESDEENQQRTNVIFLLFEAGLIESQNFCSTWPIVAARKQVEAMLE